MQYLLYFRDGFIRKFPLDRQVSIIGRSPECDLVIDEGFISRRHAQVTLAEDGVQVTDLGSKNGLYHKGSRVNEARVRLNDSFCLKTMELYLREGDPGDFRAAPELVPVFKQIGRRAADRVRDIETRYIEDAAQEVLKQLLADGLKCRGLNDFFLCLSNCLSIFSNFGDLLLAGREQSQPLYSYRQAGDEAGLLAAVRGLPDLYESAREFAPLPGRSGARFYSFPLKLRGGEALLLYLPAAGSARPSPKVEKLLQTLAREIELVAQLVPESPLPEPCLDIDPAAAAAINTANPRMMQLIKEVKRIAASELFVLIQGESGTGKELFARLLHAHSGRRRRPLVAINCAAIPESLLETEFFGHEKGAFTGAHAQKKGKLELASGGILVLDEISEMPFSMQAKLLRALEENAFFRVGGMTPIHVDLRLVSLTNSRLQDLIAAGKFRADLYYRLVHHAVTLPPLRERPEDVPLLINHFSMLFSRQYERNFRGYSAKALRTLKEYPWPGNVRQLKNEVHRLVHLVDEGGLADLDMLSEAIRRPPDAAPPGDAPDDAATIAAGEDEGQRILRLLARHNGNKSRAARELGMTYQGLHKKMKRLGIGGVPGNPGRRGDGEA